MTYVIDFDYTLNDMVVDIFRNDRLTIKRGLNAIVCQVHATKNRTRLAKVKEKAPREI